VQRRSPRRRPLKPLRMEAEREAGIARQAAARREFSETPQARRNREAWERHVAELAKKRK
jgi:hypothetical protein